MQIQCTGDFSDREGGRRSPCVKPAPFQMQIQCTRDHHHATAAASGRRPPLGPASGQRRRCITQKNPARPSAPTRHTRQRIKPPMCRLGIRSEQTSDTHQLAAAAGQPSAIDPVAARCSSVRRQPDSQKRTAATPPRARVGSANLRKPAPFQMQIQCTRAFSDREGGRSRPRKAGAVSDANSMHSRPSPRNGCGQRSATAPWPGKRPAPPVHHAKKSSAALGAHAPHAPTDKATNVPARNPERADLRYPSACRGAGQRSAIDPVAPRCSSVRRQPDSQKRTAATPPRARVGSANLRKPAPFQMQIQCTRAFSDREGGRSRPA